VTTTVEGASRFVGNQTIVVAVVPPPDPDVPASDMALQGTDFAVDPLTLTLPEDQRSVTAPLMLTLIDNDDQAGGQDLPARRIRGGQA